MGRKSAIGVVVLALAGVLSLAPVARASTAPTQKSPADGATLAFPGHPAVFSWSRVRGATTYRIQIDDAPDFVGPQEYTTSNRSFTLTEPQTVGTTFFWRVQATVKTGKNTAWSAVRRYAISWNSKPQLMEPADNSTVVDIVLSWHPVAGAATYQVQVSPNGDWANNVVVDQVVRGTRYSPLTTLPNGTYFWRVRARDGAYVPNLGAWSEERQFARAWTDAPSLQSPPNQLSPSVDVPTFKWSPTPRASDYRLEVGTDPNFSPNTFTDCDTNHTQFTYYEVPNWFYPGSPYPPGGCGGYPNNFKMQPGTTFYWRVRGIDEPAHAYGPWSQVWQFVFRGASSDVPPLQSPANGASVSDPLLQWSPVPSYPVERYQVTILLNGNQVQQTKTAGTSFTPSNLSLNTTYSWYVQTVDGYGQVGVLGSQRTFTVVAPGSTSPAPDPTGPANGSSSLRMPAMSWDPVANLDHYEVWYGIQGTGVVHRMATGLMFPSFTYADDALPPGQYIWYVIADLKNNTAVQGTIGNFIISSLQVEATSDYLSPPHCAPGTSCTPIGDTPTLKWNSVPSAGSYLVYIAIDPGFTNVVRVYATNYTELTPRESLLDNQAGQAYYWFVRPCKTPTTCGPFDDSVFGHARAFQKRSVKTTPTGPTDGSSVSNQATFSWQDYLATNQAQPVSQRTTQEARQYRIQVSTAKDFSSILDDQTVDQDTYTPFSMTYPEGKLYWRVAATDGSSNALTYSDVFRVTKSSPKISLQYPHADVVLTNQGVPYFQWTPQLYAATYEIEVYKDGDLHYSPVNRVLDAQTKMTAWAPTNLLAKGLYAWRARRIDADGRPGPWSDGRLFRLGRIPTRTAVTVSKDGGKLRVKGTLKPPRPGRTMAVSLYRMRSGSFSKLTTKSPTIGSSGGFSTAFGRPAPGSCRVVARYPGDSSYLPSSAAASFRC